MRSLLSHGTHPSLLLLSIAYMAACTPAGCVVLSPRGCRGCLPSTTGGSKAQHNDATAQAVADKFGTLPSPVLLYMKCCCACMWSLTTTMTVLAYPPNLQYSCYINSRHQQQCSAPGRWVMLLHVLPFAPVQMSLPRLYPRTSCKRDLCTTANTCATVRSI